MKIIIGWRCLVQFEIGALIFKRGGGHAIYKMSCSSQCLNPKKGRNQGFKEKGTGDVKEMSIFPFSDSILLWSLRASSLGNNVFVLQKLLKLRGHIPRLNQIVGF